MFLKNIKEVLKDEEVTSTKSMLRITYGVQNYLIFAVLDTALLHHIKEALQVLIHRAKHAFEKNPFTTLIEKRWCLADENKDNLVDFYEFCVLMNKLNFQVKQRELKALFNSFDSNSDGFIDHNEFVRLCMVLQIITAYKNCSTL